MTSIAIQKLFTFALFIFVAIMSITGCTATQKQAALCYSGCVLQSVVACTQKCTSNEPQATFNIEPQTVMQKAVRLQKKEQATLLKKKK